ncbi:hypothetical protein Tco_0810903 [Tanacetum coccineum]
MRPRLLISISESLKLLLYSVKFNNPGNEEGSELFKEFELADADGLNPGNEEGSELFKECWSLLMQRLGGPLVYRAGAFGVVSIKQPVISYYVGLHAHVRRSKQRVESFALEEAPVVTMADQCTMAELLRAPTEGYAEAIVVPPIPAEYFELKHSLINLCTNVVESIENKSKVHNSRNKPIVSQVKTSNVDSSEIASAVASTVTSVMTAMFKQHQVTPAPASVKAVEESCVTCGGAHSYRQCPATDGNTLLGYLDNIN